MYNASRWLDECLQAILDQDFTGTMEVSVFDDASTVSLCVCVSKCVLLLYGFFVLQYLTFFFKTT